MFFVIALNSKSNIKQFRNSERIPRRTSHVQYWKFMTTIPRPDHPSETIANLNPRVPTWRSSSRRTSCECSSYYRGGSERDPHTSSRQKESHAILWRNLSYTDSYSILQSFTIQLRPLSIDNAPIFPIGLIRLLKAEKESHAILRRNLSYTDSYLISQNFTQSLDCCRSFQSDYFHLWRNFKIWRE